MQAIKTIFITVINDCRMFLCDYFYNGVIAGTVFAFLYVLILLCLFILTSNKPGGGLKPSFGLLGHIGMKITVAALLGFYSYLVLGITVLSRSEGEACILRLLLFSTWSTDIGDLTLWIENIFMMLPLGILLYILWKPFRKPGWSMLAGFLCSLSIECIQLFSRRGKFETDDIMNNVFGMLIGFLFCKGISRLLS